jgi:hypothetical protein
MFTLFHVFELAGPVLGAGTGFVVGLRLFGEVGCVVGLLAGGVTGFVLARLPERMVLKSLARKLAPMSAKELRAHLRSRECLTTNIVFLELRRRGEDIHQELPIVLDMLVSDSSGRRGAGWAALSSAFPDLARKVRGYRPNESVAECRKKTEVLR